MKPASYTAPLPLSSALLTIDVQDDFTKPNAPAKVAGTWQRVPAMREIVQAYRARKLPIIHVVRLYSPDGRNADLCRRERIEAGAKIVVPGTKGAELVDSLKPAPGIALDADRLLAGKMQTLGHNEWAMYKPRWDAFFGTNLEAHLRRARVDTVVLVGCNFPNCPRATAYGASMRDFRVMLVRDAISGTYPRGLAELERIGIEVVGKQECLNWLTHPSHEKGNRSTTRRM
jgi:nicotinamidase-related amidase